MYKILLFNFLDKYPIRVGISPKIQEKIRDANKLIKLLTINLTPVFLYIAQNEVIKYQLIPKKINPTMK